MYNFTFLTKEQCFGIQKLDIFKKRGARATITDFSVLLGGTIYAYCVGDDYTRLENRTGCYWTKSKYNDEDVVTVDCDGTEIADYIENERVGVRPVIEFSSIDSIPTNGEKPQRASDGVLEVEYGYYPQQAAPINVQKELDKEFKSGILKETKNTFTLDICGNCLENYSPYELKEYEYKGKRYVRVESFATWWKKGPLSNGQSCGRGEIVWVEVSPVKWLVDEKNNMMVSEKIVFSGVEFDYRVDCKFDNHGTNFNKTNIYKTLNENFGRDLVQSRENGVIKRVQEGLTKRIRDDDERER